MDQNWLLILVILVFCQKITSGADKEIQAKEGQRLEISCTPQQKEKVSMIIWFRVMDTFRMEFIGSFSTAGMQKSVRPDFSELFSHTSGRLTLKSFKKNDSGIYSCGALFQGTKMNFGEVTRVSEDKTMAITKAPPICTTAQSVSKTTACHCKDNTPGVSSFSMLCSPIILGSLAGGCGLLLLLLIVTILYCNRIRTRRCPHHHKRRPRMAPPEKQNVASRYV